MMKNWCRQKRSEKNLRRSFVMKIKRTNQKKRITVSLDEKYSFLFRVAAHIHGYKSSHEFVLEILETALDTFHNDVTAFDRKLLIEKLEERKLHAA